MKKCSSEEKPNGKLMMHKKCTCEDKTTDKKAFTEIVENRTMSIDGRWKNLIVLYMSHVYQKLWEIEN